MFLTRAVVCIVIIFVGMSIFRFLAGTKQPPATSDRNEVAQRVIVMNATPQPVTRSWEGFGTARAMDEAEVPARVTATVQDVPDGLEPGVRVSVGDVLARLDESDFQRQVEISDFTITNLEAQISQLDVEEQSWASRVLLSEDDVRLTEAEYERVKDAANKGVAKDREVDLAEQSVVQARTNLVSTREQYQRVAPRRASLLAQIEVQKATRRLAKLNVERCSITAPIDGVLATFDIEPGENVTVGTQIARIVDVDHIEVPIRMPASARPRLHVGDEVRLAATGELMKTWSASVTRISPVDDEATRTLVIFAEITQSSDDPDRLAPGMFVQAVVEEGSQQSRWIVPRRSVQDGQVIQVQDGTVKRVPVEIDFQVEQTFSTFGLPDTHWIVLDTDLGEGYIVITATRSLNDGMLVEPVLGNVANAQSPTSGTSAGVNGG